MDTQKATSLNKITLAMISQQKTEKLAEIQASKQRITQQAKELFRPSEDSGNTHHLMNNFSSGIAIFNGIMTGFKIIRRIRNLFR
jgi:hypothetical protein